MNKTELHNKLTSSIGKCIKLLLLENQSYHDSNILSEFLEDLPYNDDWYEDIYGAIKQGDDEITRLNLIDNGYCITVCMIIGWQFAESDIAVDLDFYLLDDGGGSYHCLVKYNGKFYDAYNYQGVYKLSDLKFCQIYMSQFNEEYLRKNLKFISNGDFDEVKNERLIYG